MDDGARQAKVALSRRVARAGSHREKQDILSASLDEKTRSLNKQKQARFNKSHALLLAFLAILTSLHIIGTYLFTSGFFLTRLVLDLKSDCAVPPIESSSEFASDSHNNGCWHPKTFDKAVVILIDALRYDFTIPFAPSSGGPKPHHYHDGITVLYETAAQNPQHAFLRPFIADPPTTTLQRLKGLTTGTLPTFFDAGSNFAGTAIDEDNIVAQLYAAGRRVVHLGDDTWHALFPGLFDASLTRAYDSFNVWDLHTVDNGVNEHLLPLLKPANASKWDVIFGHYLGVDHAGHRYGPDHPAMAAKLRQMDEVIRKIVQLIDDNTLLVVMGDHGMDSKGDHGGESEDEVEAALWMYSKRPAFGRLSGSSSLPPATAKERPVNQIDLVPTLSLLLGLPIPFNNLGAPIDEAFIGPNSHDVKNLASVNRLTAAQIHRYQAEYAQLSKPDAGSAARLQSLWIAATQAWDDIKGGWTGPHSQRLVGISEAFAAYQRENLAICKALWARFDLMSMSAGVAVLLITLILTIVFARGLHGDTTDLVQSLVVRGLAGILIGAPAGFGVSLALPAVGILRGSLFCAALSCCSMWIYTIARSSSRLRLSVPRSVWSWALILFVLLQAAGFGSNSFTIWEDEHLLLFLSTAGIFFLAQSIRLPTSEQRGHGVRQSVIFLLAVRLASLSRLCREEQMPWGRSTYYASTTSSTSAPWQLAVSWIVTLTLPNIIKSYYQLTHSYQGSVPLWIGVAFRMSLLLVSTYWTLDAADDGDWLVGVEKETLKTIRMYIAQFVLCIAVGAGTATFAYMSPCIGITTWTPSTISPLSNSKSPSKAPEPILEADRRPQIVVQGTRNLYGSHFVLLPLTVLLIPLLLVQKPMGQGALSLVVVAIFSLLELLHLLDRPNLSIMGKVPPAIVQSEVSNATTALGPILLGLLAHFAYFKTGHQATLASIQWDSAFIPLRTVRYPWSPLLVVLNTFAGPLLCAAAVPATVLWGRSYSFGNSAEAGDSESGTTFSPPASPMKSQGMANGVKQPIGTSNDDEAHEDLALQPSQQDHREAERHDLLTALVRAHLTHILVYAVYNLATTVLAGHLRRHLMLYRVFCPRWALSAAVLVIAEVVGTLIGVGSIRWTVGSLAALFGW